MTGSHRTADVSTTKDCELYYLSKEDYHDVTLFPSSLVYIIRSLRFSLLLCLMANTLSRFVDADLLMPSVTPAANFLDG